MGKHNRKVGECRLDELFSNLTIDLARGTYDTRKSAAISRLQQRMRKRAEYHKPQLRANALVNFIEDNERCRVAECKLSEPIVQEAALFIRNALERYTAFELGKDSLQQCFSWSVISNLWGFGPGTSNGVTGSGAVEKIDQHMTCTSLAEPYVQQLRRGNTYFLGKDALNEDNGVTVVNGSRLTTVLKNEDTERTIGIEPSGNMAFQLAGGRYMEGALRCVGLDIQSQQPKNQYLAYLGSKDSSVCTIDLKSASNMNIIPTMRKLWPREWISFIERFRSPACEVPGFGTHELFMVSSMGNGFTFPYMTLTILALVYANRRVNFHCNRNRVDYSHTAVFGDDIIVPTREYDSLVAVLSDAGYIVNHDKSFHSGPFRESCGADYYDGYNVTPFYVKRLSAVPDIYVAINQVLRWSARHEFALFNTLRYLFNLLDGRVYLVPEWYSDTSGVRVQSCPQRFRHLRKVVRKKPYTGFFTLPLAAGGYLASDKDGASYSPREVRVRYETGSSRLPKGFLDGWDPLYGPAREANYRSLLVSMLT